MSHEEQLERIRQAIMRYRELMDIAQRCMEQGERDYARLFDDVPAQQKNSLAEKQLQGAAASIALDDLEPLRRAVLKLRFAMRDLERKFEALYNNIAYEDVED